MSTAELNTPPVSVIIPAYKARQFITEAIDSVLGQTFTGLEVLVVDDGCPQRTGELVRDRYGERVQVITQENAGPSQARNRGIIAARGEFIAFLDADDLWEPDKVALQVAFAHAHPEYGLICSSYFKDERGRHFERTRPGRSGWVFPAIFMENFIRTSTVMIRRECFDRVGLFDTELPLTQDYDLWMRMARAYQVGYIDRPLATYRHHSAGISRKTLESRKYFLRILEKNYDPALIPRRHYRRRIAYIHFHISRHYRARSQIPEARRELRTAIRLQPLHPRYWFGLMSSYLARRAAT